MRDTIGIRRETIDATEKRAPLIPEQVKKLTGEYNIRVLVEPSQLRIFSDEDYREAGAEITDDLSACNIIFGVSQFPQENVLPGHVYCFFSHTVKAQRYNMPMLRHMIDSGSTLLDYELVTNDAGTRLMSFSNFGGYAGMIDAMWALGRRLDAENIPNPFSIVERARDYRNLAEAMDAVTKVGQQIRAEGLPDEITPFVCAFTGKGEVSKGAQKIFNLLPAVEIRPEDLVGLAASGSYSRNAVYRLEWRKQDLYEPLDHEGAFNLEEFERLPSRYQGCLHLLLDRMVMIVNGVQWSPRFPRLLTKENMREIYVNEPHPFLRVIADIACDIEGSIEFTVKSTTSENPTYVYEPLTDRIIDGFAGNGPVVLAVDKLAADLPLEASKSFGKALLPFIRALAGADFSRPLDDLEIPSPFKNAVIAHQGALTKNFRYLNEYVL